MTNRERVNVAVVGATGEVGGKILEILQERQFPVDELSLFASSFSVDRGVTRQGLGKDLPVKYAPEADLSGIDLALFATDAAVSRQQVLMFKQAGALVIDNSSAFRGEPNIPLVVPEVNGKTLEETEHRVIANPNCYVIHSVMVLNALHKAVGLKKVTAATYQAVSGAGIEGITELASQIHEIDKVLPLRDLAHRVPVDKLPEPRKFPVPIAFNVIPLIGKVDRNSGYTDEELKFVHETRKILGLKKLSAPATCVRVPTMTGHVTVMNANFKKQISSVEAEDIIEDLPGVALVDIPTPQEATGRDEVLVGRIRPDGERGLLLVVAGDNLRKGAALNVVQIAELLLPRLLYAK